MEPLRSLTTVVLALLVSACAQASSSKDPLVEAWSSGKSIVVTINAGPDDTDETYGDFAYYLNNFAASAGDNWAFFTMDSQAPDPKLPIRLGVVAPPHSILFLKQGEPQGYLYPGPILEPHVYSFVQRQFEGQDVPGYLYQFSPDEVLVDWKDQVLRIEEKP